MPRLLLLCHLQLLLLIRRIVGCRGSGMMMVVVVMRWMNVGGSCRCTRRMGRRRWRHRTGWIQAAIVGRSCWRRGVAVLVQSWAGAGGDTAAIGVGGRQVASSRARVLRQYEVGHHTVLVDNLLDVVAGRGLHGQRQLVVHAHHTHCRRTLRQVDK